MQDAGSIAGRPHRGHRPPAAIAWLALCAVGLSAGILYYAFNDTNAEPSVPPAPPAGPIDVGQGVPTDFGAMAVERVERRSVATGDRLDVTVALINLAATPFPVATAVVGLRRDDGRLLRPALPSDAVAYVPPRQATRLTYRFALPAAARHLRIELTDATMPVPAIVELGTPTDIPVLKELDGPPHAH
jgi:hypothetical protein